MRPVLPQLKINMKNLTLLGILCIVLVTLDFFLINKESHPEFNKMVSAAITMSNTFKENKALRDSLDLSINSEIDPLQSGYIGIEFSPITTTIGNLPAKQTSTNPDFAALFIRWFRQISLPEGEKVIILASGSFPSLAIAAIIACEVYGLEPIILSSAGASSFGANIGKLTYWDIENNLFKSGIIQHTTNYATPGAQNDNGSSFWEGGLQLVLEAAKRNKLTISIPESFGHAISDKMEYISSIEPIALFINIGGNQTALGSGPCSYDIPTGLINEKFYHAEAGTKGLIHLMNEKSKPIIHLLQIQDLAVQYGIAAEISNKWQSGKSDVYYKVKHNLWFAGLSIFLIIIFVLVFEIKLRTRA